MRAQEVLRSYAERLPDDHSIDCLVATDAGEIIGAVIYVPRNDQGFGYIHSIGVVRSRQGHGIGTDLKTQALNNCTKAGATRVASEVHRLNGKMQRVNEKLGIERTVDPEDGKFYLYAAMLVPEEPDDEDDLPDI